MGLIERLRQHWFTNGSAELQREAATALERLKGFAVHESECSYWSTTNGRCSCDLSALLKEIDGE